MKWLARLVILVVVMVVVMVVVVGGGWYGMRYNQHSQAITVWFAQHKGIQLGGIVKDQERQIGKVIDMKPLRGGVLLSLLLPKEESMCLTDKLAFYIEEAHGPWDAFVVIRDLVGQSSLRKNQQFEGIDSPMEWKTVNLATDAREKLEQFKGSSTGRKLVTVTKDIQTMTKSFDWEAFSSGVVNQLEDWAGGVHDFFAFPRDSTALPSQEQRFPNPEHHRNSPQQETQAEAPRSWVQAI